jgi:hypothetical protein
MEHSHRHATARSIPTRGVALPYRGAALILLVTATSMLEGCNSPSTQSSVPAASTPGNGGTAPPGQAQQTQTTAPSAEAQGVALLQSIPLGTQVDVTAGFFGWRGPCQGVPPTRSAWQLADGPQSGAACIFVDGPMPAGFGPTTDPGARVRVRGSVSQVDGVRYIAAGLAEAAR